MVRNTRWKNLVAITSLSLSALACAPAEHNDDDTPPPSHTDERAPEGSAPAAQESGGADVACSPGDRSAAPVNVPTTAIKRYQSTGIAPAKGPYKPVLEIHASLPQYTIYRPETLGAVKHPILVWGNGGCSRDGTYFSKFLLEVASHGFVVVADGAPNGTGTRGLTPDGTPLVAGLDWILEENERPCSPFYHKLAADKTAVSGQSCGGLMALGASSDKRWSTVIIFNSGLFQRDQKIYSGLHTPMAYFIGGSSDVAYPQAQEDTKAISTVPLFYGNLDVGHFATWGQDNAGEFGRVGIQWLKWQLMGDATAEKVFVGADCELCKAPSKWKVVKKNLQ